VKNSKFISLSVGQRLREIRKEMGVKSAHSLSVLMDNSYSSSGILRREEGKLRLDTDFLQAYCQALDLPEGQKEEVFSLANLSIYKSGGSVLSLTQAYHNIVDRATLIMSYSPSGIPDEFQTYDYTRAVVERYGKYGNIEERTELRQKFGVRNRKDSSKRKLILMAENAMYIATGSVNIMLEQLTNIREPFSVKNLEFKILPQNSFIQYPIAVEYSIYDQKYAFSEARTGMVTAEDPETILDLMEEFNILWENSVSGEEANKLIDKAIAHYSAML